VSGRKCRSGVPFGDVGPSAPEGSDVAETEVVVVLVAMNHALAQRGCLTERVPL